jgi:hypothetical protein
MKKIVLLSCLLSITSLCFTQNVGVGTATPSQPLDVNGNINTSGNLMVNGVAGTSGQVLTMNGGAMKWMDKSRFRNWSLYTTPGAATFDVPAGVTEIMIEVWGGGGGAHTQGGGGGAGGYWIGLLSVTGGATTLNLTIGAGGTAGGSGTAGGKGGSSGFGIIAYGAVIVEGGNGADSSGSPVEDYRGGSGGRGGNSISLPAGIRSYFYANGEGGTGTSVTIIETSTSVFSRLYKGGVGGVAPFTGQQRQAESWYLDFPTGTDIRSNFSGATGAGIGQGGTAPVKTGTAGGGPGAILIYY